MVWTQGQQLQGGKYIIERELERSRGCISYLVKDKNNSNFVIKTLDEDSLTQLSPTERDNQESKFYNEALKLERCKHPHIVRVQEVFKQGQLLCIVMEYVAGETLANIARRILPEKEALGYIKQIGEALIEVHRQGLLHRDVKPANKIVRAGKYEAVLIDFGRARQIEQPLTSLWDKSTSWWAITGAIVALAFEERNRVSESLHCQTRSLSFN